MYFQLLFAKLHVLYNHKYLTIMLFACSGDQTDGKFVTYLTCNIFWNHNFISIYCLTDQWSLGIRQELPKLSQQVFLSLEETGNLRKHLIFRHPTAASTATALLHLQLLLLRGDGEKIVFKKVLRNQIQLETAETSYNFLAWLHMANTPNSEDTNTVTVL